MDTPLRIGNGSGFYGDRFEAMAELVEGGPLDVLTGDYLAELTMLILWRTRQKDPTTGYARSFLRQARDLLVPCLDRGVRIVVNAGGLNPAGLTRALADLAAELGRTPRIAQVAGDDLLPRLQALRETGQDPRHARTGAPLPSGPVPPLTANAYLGARGIAAALHAGADVVVTGRVTDASLVVGPALWRFGWSPNEHDRL
ncbi:MAG: acyclic terpene utilization AtuA family protein, partial [Nitriliruptoraceae bacterium]